VPFQTPNKQHQSTKGPTDYEREKRTLWEYRYLPNNNYLHVDDVAAELFSLPPAAVLQFQAFLTKTRKRINYFQLKQQQQKKADKLQ